MKIKIGKYTSWFGPYQLGELLMFWKDRYNEEDSEAIHAFGSWLASGNTDPDASDHDTYLYKFLTWVDSKKSRTVKVKIDKYDTWSMDHTLAYIALPMLKQLKETKQGSPVTEFSDAPEWYTPNYPKEDMLIHARWRWILNEMIFAFESNFNEWEEQFSSGEIDWKFEKDPDSDKGYSRLEHGPNHTYKVDYVGRKVYEDRIQNGYRLFGIYYQGLWN